MPIENERKFLLTNDAWRRDVERSQAMKQAYLGGEGVSVRVRIAGERAWLNIKQLRIGASRLEFEYPLPGEEAQQLMELAREGCVEKTRHYLHYADMLWEIDEFEGQNRGLIVAEIELSSVEQAFDRPPWLGREVTDEECYYNVYLANRPYCTWGEE